MKYRATAESMRAKIIQGGHLTDKGMIRGEIESGPLRNAKDELTKLAWRSGCKLASFEQVGWIFKTARYEITGTGTELLDFIALIQAQGILTEKP